MKEFSRYRRKLISSFTALFFVPLCVEAQTQSAEKIKILVVGDSLSAEYGLKRNSGWVKLLEQKIAEQNIAVTIVNASISGDTTSGGASRFPTLMSREKPDLVIIELGANDALRGLSLQASQGNLEKMVNLSKDSGAQVLLIGMQIPPNYGKQYTEAFEKMFSAVSVMFKTGLVPFLFEGFAADRSMFQSDGIHPNEAAQPIMMETVLSALRPMLLKAWPRPARP